MFAFAQPTYHQYNPYHDLAMQQELQRRRQIEAYLRRQQQVEEMERRQREYEAAVRRAEYERRRQAELQRQQAELQRRRQAQQARTRHSMYDGGLEALFDALYGGQGRRQEECQMNTPLRRSPIPTPEPTSTHAPACAPAPSPIPSPKAAEPEPEPEPEQEEPQIDTAPSHAAIQSILASFTTLQSKFMFPSQLDFLPGSSPTLAYTPNNAPLHGYEHALTGLLTKLDGVESYGDGEVRRARKEAVKAIEKELERLDGMKADRWKGVSERQAEVTTAEADMAEVDPLSVPLPEDMDVEEDETEATECEEAIAPGQGIPAIVIDSAGSQVEGASESGVEQPVNAAVEAVTDAINISRSHTPDTKHLTLPDPDIPNDAIASTAAPHFPDAEPSARSFTSQSPSETSGTDSDIELEEYVDVESMSVSEDEGHDIEQVEKDGDLELMRGWDLDF